MNKVEWFNEENKVWALGSVESRQLLQIAMLPQKIPYIQEHLQEYLTPQWREWGVRICNVNISLMQDHWSRLWEYPWIVKNGDFQPQHKVLDAGGGSSMLPYRIAELCKQVVSCDIDDDSCKKFIQTPTHTHMKNQYNLRGNELSFLKCDINSLPYPDGYFDRVTCVSVLEHTATPLKIVRELIRVTAPGGRLLITMDVANSSHKWNFTVDFSLAEKILSLVGMQIPPPSPRAVTRLFSEEPPAEIEEPYRVELSVLGFYYDKPGYD